MGKGSLATELAASYFDPLAERRGLRRKSLNASCVEYRRGGVFLEVWFNYRGAEFSVIIGRDQVFGTRQQLQLFEILDWRRVTPNIGCAAYDEANMRIVLPELARLTDENAGELLAGNAAAFADAIAHSRLMMDASALTWAQQDARKNSDKAWRAKDFAGVIAALEPLEEHLSAAELKRLEYCRKQQGE